MAALSFDGIRWSLLSALHASVEGGEVGFSKFLNHFEAVSRCVNLEIECVLTGEAAFKVCLELGGEAYRDLLQKLGPYTFCKLRNLSLPHDGGYFVQIRKLLSEEATVITLVQTILRREDISEKIKKMLLMLVQRACMDFETKRTEGHAAGNLLSSDLDCPVITHEEGSKTTGIACVVDDYDRAAFANDDRDVRFSSPNISPQPDSVAHKSPQASEDRASA